MTAYPEWTTAALEREIHRRATWWYCLRHPLGTKDDDALCAEIDRRIEASAQASAAFLKMAGIARGPHV